jgi:hypothetical protein
VQLEFFQFSLHIFLLCILQKTFKVPRIRQVVLNFSVPEQQQARVAVKKIRGNVGLQSDEGSFLTS